MCRIESASNPKQNQFSEQQLSRGSARPAEHGGAVADVWAGSDERMRPVTGLVYRKVPRAGRQYAVGGALRDTVESVGAMAQGPGGWFRSRKTRSPILRSHNASRSTPRDTGKGIGG